MTPDVNVLVAAARDDHPHHHTAAAWLDDALAAAADGARLALLPMVTAGFLRVVTQRRVFPVPTPPDQAVAFLRAVLDRPGTALLDLGPEWSVLAELCETRAVAGGDVTDAWIAVAVLGHAEHLATFDRGFRRFLPPARLTVLDP